MLKKSSLGSWWSPSPTRWPRLLWVILRPGRLPTLTRWSSRRRLWELAIKSNSSSVWGEVVIAGSKEKGGRRYPSECKWSGRSQAFSKKRDAIKKAVNPNIGHKRHKRHMLLSTNLSSHSGMTWRLRRLLCCLHSVAHRGGSAGHPCGCSGICWGGQRSSLHQRGHGPASATKTTNLSL